MESKTHITRKQSTSCTYLCCQQHPVSMTLYPWNPEEWTVSSSHCMSLGRKAKTRSQLRCSGCIIIQLTEYYYYYIFYFLNGNILQKQLMKNRFLLLHLLWRSWQHNVSDSCLLFVFVLFDLLSTILNQLPSLVTEPVLTTTTTKPFLTL